MNEPAGQPGVLQAAPEVVRVDTPAQVAVVARLAHEIWYEHYVPIIGRDQVDYMVPRFQSAVAIAEQRARGLQYFLLQVHGEAVGYFAIEPNLIDRRIFLSKFYIQKASRGRGTGQAGMAFIEASCRELSLTTIWLTVNKFNSAVQVYERMGFVRAAEIVTDIGAGYVMDDYRMEKQVR